MKQRIQIQSRRQALNARKKSKNLNQYHSNQYHALIQVCQKAPSALHESTRVFL